jgi:hypothetical protein
MPDKEHDASHAMLGLNQPEERRAASNETPSGYAPGSAQPIYVAAPPASGFSGGQAMFLLVLALLVLSGVNLYLVMGGRQRLNEIASKNLEQFDLLTRRLDSSDDRYAQLSGKFQVTTEKLGLTQQELARARSLAKDIQTQQQAAVSQLNEAIAKKASADEVDKLQADANSKFGGLSSDIAGTKQDLEATKQALLGAKGELTGAIAKTHDELVALAHKGDRDYFEFNLARRHAQQKVGTVLIELDKTDTKKNLFTVNLMFDDRRTQRKDKAMNEPIYFYVQGASSALEMVVNKLGKDSVAGYLSTPKGFFPATQNVLAGRPGA